MRRRQFIAGLGSAAAWPVVVRAQQPVIGYLGDQSVVDEKTRIAPFLQGLKEGGYVEVQNVAIEYRWAEINMIGCQHSQPTSSAAACKLPPWRRARESRPLIRPVILSQPAG